MIDASLYEYYRKEITAVINRSPYSVIVSELAVDDLRNCFNGKGCRCVYVHIQNKAGNVILYTALDIYQMLSDDLVTLENEANRIIKSVSYHNSVDPSVAKDFAYKVFKGLNSLGQCIIVMYPLLSVAASADLRDFFEIIKMNNRYPNLRFVVIADSDYRNPVPPFDTKYIKLNNSMAETNPVYISYSWKGPSDHIVVNDIQKALVDRNIQFVLDKNDCNYMSNIPQFEEKIGQGYHVVAVVSKPYVESIQCMYEMAMMFKNGNVADRVKLVFVDDFDRNDIEFYKAIVNKWLERRKKLEAEISTMPSPMNEPFVHELIYVELILKHIGEFWTFLKEENTLSLTSLGANGFEKLISKITGDERSNVITATLDRNLDPVTTGTVPIKIEQSGAYSQVYNNTGAGSLIINNNFGGTINK